MHLQTCSLWIISTEKLKKLFTNLLRYDYTKKILITEVLYCKYAHVLRHTEGLLNVVGFNENKMTEIRFLICVYSCNLAQSTFSSVKRSLKSSDLNAN